MQGVGQKWLQETKKSILFPPDILLPSCIFPAIGYYENMITIPASKRKKLQDTILSRYKDHARDLPRRRTKDPYKILVSEIMLQQTQVERVKQKYKARLEKFPTIADLAKASQADVLTLRSGL